MTVEELAQAYRDADQEYQFVIASGNIERLKFAKSTKKLAFAECNKAKKAEMRRAGF
jgi:hypothetical protein